MARFVFNLESVLKTRKHAEREQQRNVAMLETRRRNLESTLRRYQEQVSSSKDAMRGSLVGAVQTADLRSQAASVMRVMREANRVVLELAGVHQQLNTARESLREAMTQRRAIELLKESRYEAWKHAERKSDAAAADELAVIAAARTQSLTGFAVHGILREESL